MVKPIIKDLLKEGERSGDFLSSKILIADLVEKLNNETIKNNNRLLLESEIFKDSSDSIHNSFFHSYTSAYKGSSDIKLLSKRVFFEDKKKTNIESVNLLSESKATIQSADLIDKSKTAIGKIVFDQDKLRGKEAKVYQITFKRDKTVSPNSLVSSEEGSFINPFLLLPIISPPILGSNQRELFKPLFKHQVTGADFLMKQRTGLLADDPGMGKTVTTITALRILFAKGKIKRAVIVAPKSTLGDAEISKKTGDAVQWEGHLAMWAPELKTKTVTPVDWIDGKPPPGYSYNASHDRMAEWNSQAHIFLTTYQLITNDIKKGIVNLDDFDCVVLDEAQNIKNPSSQRSQILRNLKSKYRWALTGSPVENSVRDLRGIFQFLRPSEFPQVRTKELEFLQLSDIIETTREFTLRRSKSQEELPPKILHEEWIELSSAQREAYSDDYVYRVAKLKKLLTEDVTEIQFKKSIFGTLTRLKQVCNFAPDEDTSPKIKALIPIIENGMNNNEKILIFSQFVTNGLMRIEPHVKNYGTVMFYGGMTKDERNEAIDTFQKDSNVNIMLCSLQSAGVGLNLQGASIVVHFDHWWNPARMWQAEDRAHRHGQKKEVKVYSLWTKNSIEEKISNILKKKKKLIRKVQEELSSGEAEKEIEDTLMSVDDWREVFDL